MRLVEELGENSKELFCRVKRFPVLAPCSLIRDVATLFGTSPGIRLMNHPLPTGMTLRKWHLQEMTLFCLA